MSLLQKSVLKVLFLKVNFHLMSYLNMRIIIFLVLLTVFFIPSGYIHQQTRIVLYVLNQDLWQDIEYV